jgi:hypothetical protein
VCIDVMYGDILYRRRFVDETFCMCAPFYTCPRICMLASPTFRIVAAYYLRNLSQTLRNVILHEKVEKPTGKREREDWLDYHSTVLGPCNCFNKPGPTALDLYTGNTQTFLC